MNHAAIVTEEADLPYRQRAYILSELDERHFDALNPGGHVMGLNGYCLDALDEVPAGSMRAASMWPAQHYALRGVSLVEQQAREALAARLVAEILAEET